MASRESQSRAEAQAEADRTSSDEEEEYTIPIKKEEDYSLVLKDCMVYVDEGVEPLSPLPE